MLLGKSLMINAPWIFETVWTFVKNLLDENTISKIVLVGSQYHKELLKDLSLECTPETLGGKLSMKNVGFDFDIGPGGM